MLQFINNHLRAALYPNRTKQERVFE